MGLHSGPVPSVPEETARVARAAFPRGNPYLKFRDTLGALFQDEQFAALFPRRGQAAAAPWRLALVTLLQFAENLSDRGAAEAVRRCLDWKYLLSLELDDPGFDYSLLCEFRARLVAGSAELLLLETLLTGFREHQLLKSRGTQRTDSTYVLAAVRRLNRLELVGETMRQALNTLAVVVPDWLRAQAAPEWLERYARRFELTHLPESAARREALAREIGADGCRLLAALWAPEAPPAARALPAVEILRQVWVQQFYQDATQCRLREVDELPPRPTGHCVSL